jgi:hypothetical protein
MAYTTAGSWGACSPACGPGTQTHRTLTCTHAVSGPAPQTWMNIAKFRLFQSRLRARLVILGRVCATCECTFVYDFSPWATETLPIPAASCKATPGVYQQARCDDAFYSWRTGDWGGCSAACDGTQNRLVQCYFDPLNALADDINYCNPGTRPAASQPCSPPCVGPCTTGLVQEAPCLL